MAKQPKPPSGKHTPKTAPTVIIKTGGKTQGPPPSAVGKNLGK